MRLAKYTVASILSGMIILAINLILLNYMIFSHAAGASPSIEVTEADEQREWQLGSVQEFLQSFGFDPNRVLYLWQNGPAIMVTFADSARDLRAITPALNMPAQQSGPQIVIENADFSRQLSLTKPATDAPPSQQTPTASVSAGDNQDDAATDQDNFSTQDANSDPFISLAEAPSFLQNLPASIWAAIIGAIAAILAAIITAIASLMSREKRKDSDL